MPDMWMDVDAALAEVPINLLPLIDDTDFKTRETGITYDQAGMDLVWNFTTTAGATTQTAVTPTTGGDYDWAHQGDGMYTIEIPSSGGVSISNDTEGFGWFTGYCTGVLPWRGPVIGFRAAGLNNTLIDSAYSATRGLAGTALPDAAADAAGGLPISDAGGLDLDVQIGTDIDAILVDTAEIGAAGAGLTAVPWNAAWDAEVQSECTDALNVYDPPTKTEMDSAFTEIKGATWASGTDTLEHIRDKLTDIETDTQAIETDTQDLQTQIGTAGAGLTAVPWNASWDAEVQSEVQDALEANNLDHLCKVATAAADMTAELVDNTILSRIIASGDTSVFDPTTDSLQDIRDKLTDIETDTQDLQTQVGTAGDGLTGVPWNAAWDAEVQSECTDALNTYDPPTKAEMDTGHGLLATEAKQDTIDTVVDAIKVVTDNLPDSGALTTLLSNVAAILADTGTDGVVVASGSKTGYALSAAGVDAIADEEYDNDGTAISLRGAIKLILSVLTAKSSGGGGSTIIFRDINDSKNRISATVDANGNRTAVGTRDGA